MGCTVSKLDNEDTVRRCKDRRRLIKAAVHARHNLSAAHFDYCRSLRLTGAALSTFGAGEPLSVYDHAPPVLLRTQSFSSATTTTTATMRPHTPPSYYPPTVPSPPPPPAAAAAAPATETFVTAPNQQHRRKKSTKLPHILSDSSFTSSPKLPQMDYTYNAKANSTYSATPSQASSVWNWENFYPPSPPDSDFFEQLKNKNDPHPNTISRSQYDEDDDEEDKHSRYSAYSRKDKSQNNQHQNASRFPPPNSTSRSHYGEEDEEDKRSRYSAYLRKNESHQQQRQSSTGFPLPNATSRSHYDEDEEEEKLSRYSANPRNDGSHHNLRQNASGFPHPSATTRSHYGEHEEEDKRSRYSAYSRKEESHHNQPQATTGFDFFNDDKFSNYSYSNHSSRNAKNNQWNQEGYRKNNEESRHLNRSDSGEEDVETEREEVQCSEWGDHDHYSTTSSSSDEEQESRSGISRGSNFRSKTEGFDTASDISKAKTASEKIGLGNSSKSSFHKGAGDFQGKVEKLYSDDGRSTASWGNKGRGDKEIVSDTRIVVRHKDLAEIVTAIKEYFDKAASAGDQVSAMLETGRGQLDQSFSNIKKTVYHSSGVFSNLSSSWTSKPPLAVKYKFEPSSLEVSGGPKSLGSTLERLLAWEKKLYQEVKAREGVKIEHEKKLASLQNQEYKGDDDAKLDKTKASIKRLQSLIVVTSQAVSTTSAAIIDQRDSELVPQLVELCHGFMYMWRSMNQFHQVQNDIVQQVRSLVNLSSKGESTSDLHRQATRDLESAVSSWHSSFCRLIKFKRDFIRSLHGWFKLSLIPINNEEPTMNSSKIDLSESFAFSDEWKLALERVPDTVASEAIKSFINVVHSISIKQTEELKIKKRTESVSKELEKKASSLRNIEKKYYNSYSLVGIGVPDTGIVDNGHALDARDPLAEKKLELSACQRRVEDEMVKHSKAVEVTRAMTLNNIQTGLPGVFQAMTSFSALFTEALEVVCTRSYAIK